MSAPTPEQGQRCGTCKWWSKDDPDYVRGECKWELPGELIELMPFWLPNEYTSSETEPTDGINCHAYEVQP